MIGKLKKITIFLGITLSQILFFDFAYSATQTTKPTKNKTPSITRSNSTNIGSKNNISKSNQNIKVKKSHRSTIQLNFSESDSSISNSNDLDAFALQSAEDAKNHSKLKLASEVNKAEIKLIEESKPRFKGLISFEASTEYLQPKPDSENRKEISKSFLINPSYEIAPGYIVGASASGQFTNSTNSGKFHSLAFTLNAFKNNFSDYVVLAPSFRLVTPITEKQKLDGFLYGTGLRLNFSVGDKLIPKDFISLQLTLGLNKNIYKYKTTYKNLENETIENQEIEPHNLDLIFDDELSSNESPSVDYNPDWSISERLNLTLNLTSKLSFSLIYGDSQNWDYSNSTKNYYEIIELLNYDFNSTFSIYGGISNEDSLYDNKNNMNLKIIDQKNYGNTKYVMGLSCSF